MSKNTRLVWSDDPKDKAQVEGKSARKMKVDAGPVVIDPATVRGVFRLEKAGRGGKTVTVIAQLPRHETFLRELCKELKNKCGAGGTFSLESDGGQIEIQGDNREAIKAIFTKKGYAFRGM